MKHLRPLVAASVLAWGTAAHAATDADVHQGLGELVGSAAVLQELAAGHCSEFMRGEPIDIGAWYSWAAALASPAARASAEGRKTELIAQARAGASRWIANEFSRLPEGRPLERSCYIYSGIFRTIRDAAEAEIEDIEYEMRGRVTPRAER